MSDLDRNEAHPRSTLHRRRRLMIAAAGLLALGGAAGAVVVAETRPSVTMAPAVPIAVRSLSSGIVTVRGRVADIYGNKFIIADSSGRALVDTGREGERETLVTVGELVTVQGRFDRGFVHAAFLVGADSKVTALRPLGGPPYGPGGPHEHDRGPGARPPPVAGEEGTPPPTPLAAAAGTQAPPAGNSAH
jgi:hypothetical protein